MEQVIQANIDHYRNKSGFWTKLYCHFFGHSSERAIIEDEELITRYACKKCHRRLGNGLRKTLPVPKGIDPIVWHNYMQELIESYKRYEGIQKHRSSRRSRQ